MTKQVFFPHTNCAGETDDPVADLIAGAYRYDMKVIRWFACGFMAHWGEAPAPENNAGLAKHPVGMHNQREIAHYNRADYYCNACHSQVQQCLPDLVSESLESYPEVGGIRRDDRLPVSPTNPVYDPHTPERYRKEHNGNAYPEDFHEEDWVRWRLDLLNDFAVKLHQVVKSQGTHQVVAFSPNPSPWCKQKSMACQPPNGNGRRALFLCPAAIGIG